MQPPLKLEKIGTHQNITSNYREPYLLWNNSKTGDGGNSSGRAVFLYMRLGEGLTALVTQKEWKEEVNCVDMWGETSQAEGTARAKGLGWECVGMFYKWLFHHHHHHHHLRYTMFALFQKLFHMLFMC